MKKAGEADDPMLARACEPGLCPASMPRFYARSYAPLGRRAKARISDSSRAKSTGLVR
jgi:hypothetical protein